MQTDRHEMYVEVRAYRRHLRHLVRRLGWDPVVPGMFDRLRADVGMREFG